MKVFLLWTLTVVAAGAQTINVESLFQPAPLSGMWKHHTGDDPRWADPAFDDSAWQSVRMPEAAAQPGNGFSWYRFRVRLPETMPKEPRALMSADSVIARPMKSSGMGNAPEPWDSPMAGLHTCSYPYRKRSRCRVTVGKPSWRFGCGRATANSTT